MLKLLAVLLLAAASFAQSVPSAITTDPTPPAHRTFAARMVELYVPASDGSKMNGIMYLAAGEGPHPTVILLHGFPGNEQNLDLAQSIRRAGWNVLYFHYRGVWGSQGDFSFTHATEDTAAAAAFVHDWRNVKKYRIDPSHVVLVGHSMGGFMAAYTALKGTAVESGPQGGSGGVMMSINFSGVVLISPWDMGRAGYGLSENKKFLAEATEEFRGYQLALHGFTAESGIAELRKHKDDWQLTKIATQIVERKVPVLMVTGKFEDAREEGFDLLREAFRKAASGAANSNAGANAFTSVELPTDHAYSDQRIALQSAIVTWLGQFTK